MKKLIIILGLVMILCFSNGGSADQAEDQGKKKASSAYDTGSGMLANYWERAKVSVEKLQEYFFPPNIDFRSSEAHERGEEGGGAGEKVKEAATKSLETSKSTLEESAKLASETVTETADKVKRSLSDKLHHDHHHQQSAEL